MSDPAGSTPYPPWLLRFNRMLTSRTATCAAAAMFVLDGVPRLLDGRVIRGVGNLVVAAALVGLRERIRRSALGESAPAERRAVWVADHPVAGALLMGAAWGAAMSLCFVATTEAPIPVSVAVGLGSGILFFGPLTAILSRRYRRSTKR